MFRGSLTFQGSASRLQQQHLYIDDDDLGSVVSPSQQQLQIKGNRGSFVESRWRPAQQQLQTTIILAVREVVIVVVRSTAAPQDGDLGCSDPSRSLYSMILTARSSVVW